MDSIVLFCIMCGRKKPSAIHFVVIVDGFTNTKYGIRVLFGVFFELT